MGWEYEYTMIIISINKYEKQRILKIGVDIESVLDIWVPPSHPEGNIHKGLCIEFLWTREGVTTKATAVF